MAKAVIKHTYELKRGQEEALDRVNPLLLRGEPVVVYREDGTTNIKVGDGVHNYKDLPFITKLPEMTQSDWDEKDTNSPDYITGKPISKTVSEKIYDANYTIANNVNEDPIVSISGPKLGLEIGKTYIVHGLTISNNNIQIECVATEIEFPNLGNVTILSDNGNECIDSEGQINCNYFILVDNVVLGADNTLTYGDGSVVMMLTDELTQVTVKELYSREVTLDYDKDYLPLLQSNFEDGDPESPSYIKNKPCYTEYRECEGLVLTKDDFTYNSDISIYDGSFGLLKDQKYTINLREGTDYLYDLETRVVDDFSKYPEFSDFNDLIIPQGSLMLMVNIEDGWTPLLLQNAILNEDTVEFEYSEIYSILFMRQDEIQDSQIEIFGKGLGHTRIAVTKKLDNKYLNIDKEFDGKSDNAQSGIAIQGKLKEYTKDIRVADTLDDGYIHVTPEHSTDDDIENKDYNIYTTGLGLRTKLKTKNKNTLVEAINENVENIEDIKSKSTLPVKNKDLVFINGEQVYLLNYIPYDQVPYAYRINKGATISTFNNLFIDLENYKVISFDNNGHKVVRYITNTDIIDNALSNSTNIYNASYKYYKYVNHKVYKYSNLYPDEYDIRSHYIIYIDIKNKDDTYGQLILNMDDNSNYIPSYLQVTVTNYGTYRPLGTYYESSDSTSTSSGGSGLKQYTSNITYTYNKRYGFKSTNLEKPGILEFPESTTSFGSTDYSNAQVVAYNKYHNVTGNYNFFRALQNDGTEIVKLYMGSIVDSTYTNIDNNEHSSYINLNDTTVMCLSSSGEILYRDNSNGNITKRQTVITDTDLFTENLQYVSLHIYGDTLYVARQGRPNALFAINFKDEQPTAVFLKQEFGTAYTTSCGDSIISHTSGGEIVNLLRNKFNPNDLINYDIEYIFDGGNAPIE